MSRTLLKACAHCGALFGKDPRNTWAYWEKRARFCSQACAGKAHSAEAAAIRPDIRLKFRGCYHETDGCWNWTWLKDKDGYGLFPYAETQYRAHRLALMLAGHAVPNSAVVCHHCDNPGCVRPDHLYVGTHRQNMEDAKARGRIRSGERIHSSRLTEAAVTAIRASPGTHEQIASQFGVARSTISLIRERKTWKHVP